MAKVDYLEGDWFLLPLRDGLSACGIVARAAPKRRIAIGFFYLAPLDATASSLDLERFRPKEAALIARFGDLGLVDGSWTILGRARSWSRNAWPNPLFCRESPLDGSVSVVEYPNGDPAGTPRVRPGTREECAQLPRDGLYGSIAIQDTLEAVRAGAKTQRASRPTRSDA